MMDCFVVAERWLLLTVAVIFLLGAALVPCCFFFAEEWSWLTCKLVMELLLCEVKSAGCCSGSWNL